MFYSKCALSLSFKVAETSFAIWDIHRIATFISAVASDVYPMMFKPLNSKNKFTGMGDGDGRNGKLFAHISTLIHAGFTKEETIQIPNTRRYAHKSCADGSNTSPERKDQIQLEEYIKKSAFWKCYSDYPINRFFIARIRSNVLTG